MTTQEKSFGPLYFATDEALNRWFWPHLGDVSEMCEPYRTGRVLILPTGLRYLVAVGFWTRDIYDDVHEWPNRWPDWMQSYEPDPDPDFDGPGPSWVKGATFKPRALTEEELNETAETEARGVEES